MNFTPLLELPASTVSRCWGCGSLTLTPDLHVCGEKENTITHKEFREMKIAHMNEANNPTI